MHRGGIARPHHGHLLAGMTVCVFCDHALGKGENQNTSSDLMSMQFQNKRQAPAKVSVDLRSVKLPLKLRSRAVKGASCAFQSAMPGPKCG